MPAQVNLDGDGFVTGLSAVNVPSYVDAEARDSFVSTVVGKLVFMQDTSSLVIYDGTDWVAA